jgi:hypothetical protein
MAKVTYNSPPGDDEIVQAFGQVFESGKATELPAVDTDENLKRKIMGNPHFELAGEKKAQAAPQGDEGDKRLAELANQHSEEVRKLRQEIARLEQEAQAKDRALAQVSAVQQVRAASAGPTVTGTPAAAPGAPTGGEGVATTEALPTPRGGGSPDHNKRTR